MKREAQMDIPRRKVIQDCPTRWNSTFYMLQRLVELRWPLTAVLADERVTKPIYRNLDLKSEQWNLAEELVKVLHPIELATTFLSYEENVSISCVLPVLCGLVKGLEKPTNSDATVATVITNLKRLTANEIKTRWNLDNLDSTGLLVLAAAVDPRFRQLSFLEGHATIVDDVKQELTRQMELIISNQPDNGATEDTEVEPAAKKKKTAFDIMLGEEDTDQVTPGIEEELQAFFSERAVARSMNPLNWWRDNCKKIS